MSTLDLGLLLNGVDRGIGRAAAHAARPASSTHPAHCVEAGDDLSHPPLRMVLVEGETLRLPHSRMRVNVLSGTAWITQAGTDTLLHGGACLDLSAAGDQAVISAIGKGPLFFEMR